MLTNTSAVFGLDNWGCQKGDRYEADAKRRKIKLAYIPGDTTELCGVTDLGPGNEVKRRMTVMYGDDIKSSVERLKKWKTGEVNTSERRILMTKWLGDAWDDYTKNNQDKITLAFKKCGMFNALDGSENHLVEVPGIKDYKPPKKTDPQLELPKKKAAKKKKVVKKWVRFLTKNPTKQVFVNTTKYFTACISKSNFFRKPWMVP